MSLLPLVRIWIGVSVLASAAGWILSAVGELNRVGYSVFFAFVAVVWVWARKRISREEETLERVDRTSEPADTPLKRGINGSGKPPWNTPKCGLRSRWHWRRVRWRFRHGLPACF